jgi:hypothetical protein
MSSRIGMNAKKEIVEKRRLGNPSFNPILDGAVALRRRREVVGQSVSNS